MSDNRGGFGGVSVGKPNQPVPKSKPNENLTASLRATLRIVETTSSDSDPIPSPLSEAIPNSVDILLDRINNHMIEGKILSDDDLRAGIDLYRAQALKYAQEQETKKPRAKSAPKATLKQALDLDELDFGLLDGDGASEQ